MSEDEYWNVKEKELGKIKCSSSDCENGLHTFQRRGPKDDSYRNEVCAKCGADLKIDWSRLDRRQIDDVEYTFSSMKYEMFRRYYWWKPVDEQASLKAISMGAAEIREWAVRRIAREVARPVEELFRDGTQTPLHGNIVFYAQHATGCCCRKCLEEWHGFDRHTQLGERDVYYLSGLVSEYVSHRIPALGLPDS